MTISAIARGLLLIAFSYAISNDSIKARRVLLHAYIAESVVQLLYQCYLYYQLDKTENFIQQCEQSQESHPDAWNQEGDWYDPAKPTTIDDCVAAIKPQLIQIEACLLIIYMVIRVLLVSVIKRWYDEIVKLELARNGGNINNVELRAYNQV